MTEIGRKIIAAVRERVQANPDFVYEPRIDHYNAKTCMYVRDGDPSCLIGCGLWDAELIGPELENDPALNEENMPINESPAEHLLEYLDLEVSYRERSWLETAQAAQDRLKPWGQAIIEADEAYPVFA